MKHFLTIPALLVLIAASASSPSSQPTTDPVAAMSLEDKVGQLFLISVVGKEAPVESSVRVLKSVPVGGVILFAYNLRGGPDKVAALNASLQEIALSTGAGLPYLIAVDQEGGRVQRLKRGFSRLPAPRQQGLLKARKLEQLAGHVADQLTAVGVNMNLAPVVEASAGEDDVIADRGFATTADAAAPLAAAYIRGLQRKGVLATAKHFPGNAGSVVDPHKAMPSLSMTRQQIEQRLLPPFRAAIKAGVDALMLSHIEIPALDDKHPVALSHAVVTGLVREQLAFDGIICSDDLLMGAVTEKFDPAEAAILAVLAGTDLLMVSNPAEVPRMHKAIVEAVRGGRIKTSQIDAAARRLVRAKQQRSLLAGAQRLQRGESLADLSRARRRADRMVRRIPAATTQPAPSAKTP